MGSSSSWCFRRSKRFSWTGCYYRNRLVSGLFVLGFFQERFRRTTPPPSNELQELKQLIQRLEQKVPLDRSISDQEFRSPKNPDDIYTVPHTHNQSTDLTLSSFKKEIVDLCDIEKLQEEDCIFTEDLIEEKKQINLLMQNPETQPLLTFIKERKGAILDSCVEKSALGALFVLLGIKPALVKDAVELDKELLSVLTNLVKEKDNLFLKAFNNFDGVYFVNENPFPSFNPRNFLNLSSEVSFTKAIAICYPNRGHETHQCLSYLLGYGPSWEAFQTNLGYQEKRSISCIYNSNHYYEIGKVLNQSLFKIEKDKSEIESLGFIFHSQFVSLVEQGGCRYAKRNIAPDKIKRMLGITGTAQIFDGLTARTDYFKKSYTLKKWVMETYFPQLL